MRLTPSIVAQAALVLGLTFSAGAQAQDAAAAPDARQTKVEQRIRDMYATLHITKAQDPEWNAFAQVMLDNAQAMESAVQRKSGDRSKLSAPQIMENYAEISAQHSQNVEKLSAALEVLYAGLSPDQQRTADELFRNYQPKPANGSGR
ncbi:Spy/CpxP family protein refolding chaperone [Rhodoblastus sp.]|jgi:hypothetical protein|uniref:Spy/CpxP family protein refolding chaperone n=1 Tax=Rhodoblastus sp. TaxID=1962975 RepID=UPI0026388794|nr:Spy/CpxP family protein refolding chaperone [Rhodoblastus sp.]